MTKWEKFYNNQNETTRAWLDAQAKADSKFALSIGVPLFLLGIFLGFIIGVAA